MTDPNDSSLTGERLLTILLVMAAIGGALYLFFGQSYTPPQDTRGRIVNDDDGSIRCICPSK